MIDQRVIDLCGLDPVRWAQAYWPHSKLYDKQAQILESMRYSYETYVPAGNMLGKDYIAGKACLLFFLRPFLFFPPEYALEVQARATPTDPYPHTVRIVTTSVKDDHLRVLWGEIGRFVQTSAEPLDVRKGGRSLLVRHRDIKRVYDDGTVCDVSYLRGMVSEKGEGLAGHHAAYSLIVGDEASGLDNLVYTQSATWAKRHLYIGNPNPCTNFFREAVKGGDVPISKILDPRGQERSSAQAG